MIRSGTKPRLARKVQKRFDRLTQQHMLVYPERGAFLSASSHAIIELCTGELAIEDIIERLHQIDPSTGRDVISREVHAFLEGLVARGLLLAETDGPVPFPVTEPSASPGVRPYTLIAELTYRCPLRCAYCSNPVHYATQAELTTEAWQQLLSEAEALGVVQVNFTGGEPLLRPDLAALIARAHGLDQYTSLITSAVGLTRERLTELANAGLDHVQISIQGMHESDAQRIAGREGLAQKLESMRWVRELDLALTINVVLHRENIQQVPELIALTQRVGAERLELANTQYLGWALENRTALLPSHAQIQTARAQASAAREQLRGKLDLLFVLPDYDAEAVRPCMQGWARRYMLVTPDGLVLPCHQAHTLPGLHWERAGERPLAAIWSDSEALNAFRGTSWMQEPCRSCERRELDFGGCRCQAFHLTGKLTATDPACQLAPEHGIVAAARLAAERGEGLVPLRYRRVPR